MMDDATYDGPPGPTPVDVPAANPPPPPPMPGVNDADPAPLAAAVVLVNVDGKDVPMPPEIAAAIPSEAPAPVRWAVPKLVLVDRLIAAGLAANASAALNGAPIAKMRFDAAVEIYSDDADARGFLAAIGGDPDQLLSPPGA